MRNFLLGLSSLFIFGLCFIALSPVAYAANDWVATENFNSYSGGSNINGGSGGYGWTSNWFANFFGGGGVGSIIATTSPAGGQGGNALLLSGYGSALEATRNFTAVATGTLSVRVMTDNSSVNTADSVRFQLMNSNNQSLMVIIFRGSDIEAWNNDTSSYETIYSGYSPSTWYTFLIKFGSGEYSVSVNGGAYSSSKGYQSGSPDIPSRFGATIDSYPIRSYDLYVDDISPAWAATDDFDSYSNAADINGGSGGDGWTSNWITNFFGGGGVGSITTVTAPAGGQGGNALELQGHGPIEATRNFATTTTGMVTWQMQTGISPTDTARTELMDSGNNSLAIVDFVGSDIKLWNNDTSSYETIYSNYATSTWYTITMRYGIPAGKYAVNINGGGYSADKGMAPGVPERFGATLDTGPSQSFDLYLDDIKASN